MTAGDSDTSLLRGQLLVLPITCGFLAAPAAPPFFNDAPASHVVEHQATRFGVTSLLLISENHFWPTLGAGGTFACGVSRLAAQGHKGTAPTLVARCGMALLARRRGGSDPGQLTPQAKVPPAPCAVPGGSGRDV